MRGNNVLNILEEVSEYCEQKLIFSLTDRQAIGKESIRGKHMPRGAVECVQVLCIM
jgi:hypothetical protein